MLYGRHGEGLMRTRALLLGPLLPFGWAAPAIAQQQRPAEEHITYAPASRAQKLPPLNELDGLVATGVPPLGNPEPATDPALVRHVSLDQAIFAAPGEGDRDTQPPTTTSTPTGSAA